MESSVNIAAQTLLFLQSILLGAVLCLLYDLFRVLRVAFQTPAAIVAAEDLLYCAICAAGSFLFIISANYGEIRWFLLFGEGLGALLCRLTLSRLVMACSKAIIALFRKVFRMVWRIFLRPIYLLIRWNARILSGGVDYLTNILKKSLRKANYSLKRRQLMLYNLVKVRRAKQAGNPPKRKRRSPGKETGIPKEKDVTGP